jgi:glycosyltransferase involved in cell wall biosynthesis
MNTMKILIATGLYPPEIGGPATYALLLEEELPKRGFEIVVVPFGWVRHYPKIIRHGVYVYKLWRESRGVDVMYALDPISVGLPALIVANVTRTPFLLRLGGDYAWEQGVNRFGITQTLDEFTAKKVRRPCMVQLLSFVQTFVSKRALKVVAPSEYLKSIIASWGVKQQAIVVIHSALYPLVVEETKEELKKQLSFSTPTIISAGRLVPWKGFSTLVEVIAKMKDTYPDISLIIAGDGGELATLQTKVKEHNVEKHVRFVGRISKDALGASIKAADVFVLNTAYEGLSHQLIEVMDLGTPIITTNIGGNPELITNGINGILVSFDDVDAIIDGLVRLLEYPETRSRIVQSARGRSKDFSQHIMLEKIGALLNDVYDKKHT